MKTKVKLLLVGPVFYKDGEPLDQMGKLEEKFRKDGFQVSSVSNFRNRFIRLFDTIYTLIVKINTYDLILIQSFGFKAFILEDIASIIGKYLGKKIYFNIRGGAFMNFYNQNPKWVRRVLKRATFISTPSSLLAKSLNDEGFNVSKISDFIDIDRFTYSPPSTGNFKILWVRAFHQVYNPHLAVDSFKIIFEKYPKATLTMVGPDQGLLNEISRLIDNYDLKNKIKIVGPVDNKELPDYYKSHSVFITTTHFESFGAAIFEAASCGIPMVSTKVGEIPFLWKDGHDILLSESKPDNFAKQIAHILDKPQLAMHLSINARQKAEMYQWDFIKDNWSKQFFKNKY
jgi:glycosyltransferase involved in cell wall biosynthesis